MVGRLPKEMRVVQGTVECLQRTTSGCWSRLPSIELERGGRASRLLASLGAGDLFTVVLCASAGKLSVTFEIVERRPLAVSELDPRLGLILVDGRTLVPGIVDTVRGRLTYTSLSTYGDRLLVQALRGGRQLGFWTGDRLISADLQSFGRPFAEALGQLATPDLPLAGWLEG